MLVLQELEMQPRYPFGEFWRRSSAPEPYIERKQ
jgi:hypothetical protein